MGRLRVVESLTLDGVMQAPGRADEDTRGGFQHGGWAIPYVDDVMGRAMGEQMGARGSILLGRRTYADFAEVWPNQKGNPYSEALNAAQKYVVSNSLSEPLPWENSTLIAGDAPEAVTALKDEDDGGLTVLGSGELVRSLLRAGLIDEYLLLIHPLILGSGTRLFAEGEATSLELADSLTTGTGVVIATYRPAPGASPGA
jgi:dihydrofolate reductase